MKDPILPYRLLDTGNLQKLEMAGPYKLIRPALTAFWTPTLPEKEWGDADGIFIRDAGGNGKWHWRKKVPESWKLRWGDFVLTVKPTGFGHLGFFAEQFRNWAFFSEWLSKIPEAKALNLFAYSGVGSMAMARGGAQVCHLDASRGMIEWGRGNLPDNPRVPDRIRWIADDVNKFVKREIRRGSRYQLIALDPPTFGRGTSGQLWKIESDLPLLLEDCRQLLAQEGPVCLELSCHSPGFTPLVLERLLRRTFGKNGTVSVTEMSIPESTGSELPSGFSARYLRES